jgi:hypothetical protein
MDWSPILGAVVLAIVITLAIVSLLGWRRPGATATESVVISALFFFFILFLATWAANVWISPRDPSLGVPWLASLAVALVITLLFGALAQPRDRRRSRNAEPTTPDTTTPDTTTSATTTPGHSGEIMLAGFGVAFWALLVVLLLTAVAGSLRM